MHSPSFLLSEALTCSGLKIIHSCHVLVSEVVAPHSSEFLLLLALSTTRAGADIMRAAACPFGNHHDSSSGSTRRMTIPRVDHDHCWGSMELVMNPVVIFSWLSLPRKLDGERPESTEQRQELKSLVSFFFFQKNVKANSEILKRN